MKPGVVVPVASMRPQHITAETPHPWRRPARRRRGFNEAAAYNCGNRKAYAVRATYRRCFNEAAAYNCGNRAHADHRPARRGASMRPQHITAETLRLAPPPPPGAGGFNEAAAYNCGNPLRSPLAYRRDRRASMRPQHITAETARRVRDAPIPTAGFNEAAAYNCGNRWSRGGITACGRALQ